MKPNRNPKRTLATTPGMALYAALCAPLYAALLIGCGGNVPQATAPAFTPQVTLMATPTSAATATTAIEATATTAPSATSMPTASPAASTMTPPLSGAIPSTTSVAIGGPAISYGGVSFNLESGLGISVSARLVPTQAEDANGPTWAAHPQYTEIALGGYPSGNTFHQPRVEIYPVAAFEASSEGAKQIIERLKQMLANKPALTSMLTLQPEGAIPFLPLFNAAQIFHAKPEYISFANGIGVRFITQFDQAPIPINNQEVFYTFQGLTGDGQYYVAAILPVNAPVLADDNKPDTTGPEVVPFPANDMNEQTLSEYFGDVIARLDVLPANQFTPSLATLDALIQSMQVGP